MIKKDIVYIGEQKAKDIRIWGLPFHFDKNKPVSLEEKYANAILERGKIFSEVNALFKIRLLKKNKINKKINILITRSLGGLGDVLMNTPVFRAIKENIKNVYLTYACLNEFIPLIENNPYLDNYMVYDRSKINSDTYDIIIDVTRCCAKYEVSRKPKVDLHRSDIYLKQTGFSVSNKLPYYKVTSQERKKAKQFIGKRKVIGFQLHSNGAIRDWDLSKYKELAKMITDKWKNLSIILFDVDNNLVFDGTRIIHFIGKPIREVAALIEQCKVFVSVDSGLMHLAGALSVPQVTMFGNIDALCRTKYYLNTKVIQLKGQIPCIPCWMNDCPSRACMKNITAIMVMEKLEDIIDGKLREL